MGASYVGLPTASGMSKTRAGATTTRGPVRYAMPKARRLSVLRGEMTAREVVGAIGGGLIACAAMIEILRLWILVTS